MTNNRLNTALGWVSFAFAAVVYALTAERTASFWDCGEFISASLHLQVVHPPGAPLFLMLGNLFSQLASDAQGVAFAVNMLSAITSAFCVMFTFWIITHYAHKHLADREEGWSKNMLIFGAGFTGALALTFSDTFWFSAVEAEVYAASSFLSMLTFWAILKWERVSDESGSDRWLIFIAYLIGLGIGVHLLNLLVIPAIVYVYYFKKYPFNTKGFFIASGIGVAILGFVQVGVIPGIPTIAAVFDRYFVNELGMEFGSGILFFGGIFLALLTAAIVYSQKTNKTWLNTGLLCFTFVLLGYSSYSMVVIRSLANPPIDMNNPEEPFNLVSYLNREQYGSRDLVKGPYFNAPAIDIEQGKQDWRKGENTYEPAGFKNEYVWDPKYITWFPRMGDQQKSSSPQGYNYWADVNKDQVPTMGQNLTFFFKYQLGHMYWRYFLWNFAGRQNVMQGDGDPVNGNWISGITFLDEMRLGPQSNQPEAWTRDVSRNTYFMLPLILGLMGLLYQYSKNKNDFFIVSMLFLFTGILIAVYLNAPPYEPRERDYTLVGSFQIFTIWIGLGVIQLADWLSKWLKGKQSANAAVAISLLAVPALMGAQNWDDHDRSERNMVLDYAKNYLQSCDSNALLFTNGDNDTYPLWYIQNVEGFRTDVRVVNLQLLNFDWYIEALTRQVMGSAPFKITVPKSAYPKGVREHLTFFENKDIPANQDEYYPYEQVLAFITNDDNPKAKRPWYFDELVNYVPVRNMKIKVDQEKALAHGILREQDMPYAAEEMRFSIAGSGMLKADWITLHVIQENGFERPIYFASNSINSDHLGLGKYFRLDGLVYKLVPVNKPKNPQLPVNIDSDIFYKRLVEQFNLGGIDNPKVLLDEQSIRMSRTFRNYFGILAVQLAIEGKRDSVLKVVEKIERDIPQDRVPYEYTQMIIPLAQACYEVEEFEKGDELLMAFADELEAKIEYFSQYSGLKKRSISTYLNSAINNMGEVYRISKQYNRQAITEALKAYEPINR